jgi:hypothetical protein
MGFLRSYGRLTTLGWICALVFVASITDASLTESELAARLAYGLAAIAMVVLFVLIILQRKLKRQTEAKVTASATILLTDIKVLARSNSKLLADAIALHSAQQENSK